LIIVQACSITCFITTHWEDDIALSFTLASFVSPSLLELKQQMSGLFMVVGGVYSILNNIYDEYFLLYFDVVMS